MTYQDYRRICMDATECADLETYIAEVGGSLPETVRDDAIIPTLTAVYAIANDPNVRTVRTVTGLSQAAFARAYNLPLRSVENWESKGNNARTAPGYVLDLLAYAVICDIAEAER